MIKLYNKDCIEFLGEIENDSIDLICIDPPYNISRETSFCKGKPTGKDADRFRREMIFGEWDKDFNIEPVIKECYRVLKEHGTIICFYDLWKITNLKEYMEKYEFKQLRFIEWVKTNPMPINSSINYLTNAREIAITACKKNKPVFNSKYDNGIYSFRFCNDKGRFHPTQKPVKLIEELIKKHSNEGDLVLDCFSGSGTTAVACFNTNRNFIGTEFDKKYYDKSIYRIKLLTNT